LSDYGVSGYNIEDVLAYPYYHVFHGVVTQVGHSYSAGVQTITVQCASMLHFWQYHQMSTNASLFGARPSNSKLKMSMVGHNFTGWHPYQIIYYLHNDTAGSAGGVAWALSQKTNQDARSPLTGESLFSLNVRYWQQRFNKREIKLRLHGATGQIFNSAQAAYLGRTSSDELTRMIRGNLGKIKPSGKEGQILNQSTATAMLMNPGALKSLNWTDKSAPVEGAGFDLNMIEMQAFVSNIGQWGQIQLFESTYESKLDVAQKVCEVTGFEFYQDVDGDFVFKPPMYNLDTSTSRVYRIEDIDIINISFDEKEPQVTYMTCKGTPYQNTQGTGVENEWGVQGQYIDYRLVAQYGWRPGNYETAYFTDPRQMFFAAVNRLDIMNAPSKSASVTIPERPEIRPGYPVFIPYLDCYYYCNSFAHSHSVGGECTTSLQLVGKRAKFFAPGDPNTVGIEAVNLQYTSLPQRPLRTLGLDERPELAGFPNVVMALDPGQLNPLFFITGSDVEDLSDPSTLFNVLKMGVEQGVITTDDRENPGPYYYLVDGSSKTQTFFFQPGVAPSTAALQGGAIDLGQLAQKYADTEQGQTKKIESRQAVQVKILGKMSQVDAQLAELRSKEQRADEKEKVALAQSISAKEQERQRLDGDLAAAKADSATALQQMDAELKSSDLAPLTELIKSISGKFFTSKRFGNAYGNFNDTATLLDLLSDKKAIFTNGQLPGSYRYYSASHPDALQQGQPALGIAVETQVGGKKVKKTESSAEGSVLSPKWRGFEVDGFVPTSSIQAPSGTAPEAKRGKVKVKRGIRVLTSDPNAPHGEVVPTSEIRELMFAVHDTMLPGKKTGTKRVPVGNDLNSKFREKLLENAVTSGLGQPLSSDSIDNAMGAWTQVFLDNVAKAGAAASAVLAVNPQIVSPTLIVTLPSSVGYRGFYFPTGMPMDTYLFQDTTGTKQSFSGCEKATLANLWKELARNYAAALYARFGSAKENWLTELRFADASNVVLTNAETAFYSSLCASYGVTQQAKGQLKTAHKTSAHNFIHSPVFPISDARGYEVIGSYRYGRDIDIDPNGAFDTLHKAGSQATKDMELALQYLNRQTIEDFVDAVVRGKPIWIDDPKSQPPTVKKIKVLGAEAAKDVERRALEQLRRQLTDNQLIDLGLLKQSGDPGMLEMNLSNWFADTAKDGLHKVPLVNAAYSLADLTAVSSTTCTCKAAEADVLLEAAGQAEFVRVSPGTPSEANVGVNDETDSVTAWEVRVTAQQSQEWQLSQQALRGALSSPRTSTVLGSVSDIFGIGSADQSVFTLAGQQLQQRKEQLLLQARELEFPEGGK